LKFYRRDMSNITSHEPPAAAGRDAPQFPAVGRPDAGVALVSQWAAGTADRQRLAIGEAAAAWKGIVWPEALLSIAWFASIDGESVFTYSQWSGDEGADAFARTDGPTLLRRLPEVVPGLETRQPTRYRLYRSGVRENAPTPGCVVIVSVEFDGPDAARQRRWVDLVFDALAAEPSLHPGGISGHFHVSVDGTRVLNYAEWTSADAHRKAIERSGQGTIGAGKKWREVQGYPGVVRSGFTRYQLVTSMHSGENGRG
jgi:Antibiotic biosynthesis monooxygenase